MNPVNLSISFHHKLRDLLHPKFRELETVHHQINYHGSIKDVIESLRIPHTEVGRLEVNGKEVGFSYQVRDRDKISVLAHTPPVDPCVGDRLRPTPLPKIRFIVDVNVAKLCSLLRMVGFDTRYIPEIDDRSLAEIGAREQRIVLSRDRGLLKRKIIIHGHLVRAHLPEEQLKEIIHFYGLEKDVHPFSRCMSCNALLKGVEKSEILDKLEPLTKQYYNTFQLCLGCGKIYWSGSHKPLMSRLITKILTDIHPTG